MFRPFCCKQYNKTGDAVKYHIFVEKSCKKVCLKENKVLSLRTEKQREEMKIQVRLRQEAREFIKDLPEKVRTKIIYNISRIENGTIDKELFKKLNSNIWEIRTLYYSRCFRLLAFWDTETETLVIVTHGFEKKTNKTPKREIEKAEELRKKYFNNK